MSIEIKTFKKPSLSYAIFVLFILASSTFIGMKFLGAPLNVIMFINWGVMSILALPLGFSYDDLEKKASESLKGIMTTLFILFAIGSLVGTWMAAGTVPAIIYYGINIMTAKFFLVSSLFLCSIVSLATGTSWGTLGTIGISLLAIGSGLGVPIGMTAGAIICGSWFGDKMSPLSDSSNFTAAIVGTDIITHIKHNLLTTTPAYIISAILFTILGFNVSKTSIMNISMITQLQEGIKNTYNLGFPVLIPVILVFSMLLMRKNATLSLLVGSISAIAVSIFYQGFSSKLAFQSFYGGFKMEFDSVFLASLLNRGGIVSMLSTSVTIIFCVGIGGMMKEMGVIHIIVDKLAQLIKSIFGLIFVSEVIAYVSQMLSGSHYFSDVMLQSTMLDMYEKKGLKPENLSRVMGDCNTIGGILIPWSSTALYIVGTLGLTYSEYIPYVFLCYFAPLMDLIYGFTGLCIARIKKDNENNEEKQDIEDSEEKQIQVDYINGVN